MDFVEIKEKLKPNGMIEVYPNFRVKRSKDLMVRGRSFYAIWDEKKGMWSTDAYDVQRLVDSEIAEYRKKMNLENSIHCLTLGDFSSNMWQQFERYIKSQPDCSTQLDDKLTFLNTEVTREDYVSHRLPYPLEPGSIDAYDELMSVLYSEEERAKIEWAIGAVIDGAAKNIQKFLVFYGEAGTGKSTVLNIIEMLFEGYFTTFEAKALTSTNNAFATEVFKNNPLVAIQHDGDLSRIEDNTKLNSIVSHELMTMNEKYKSAYMSRINAFLFMGTNKPVKITDAKSGIIRRLIDVRPTGNLIPASRYHVLMNQIGFELGAIASHCLDTYRKMGKNYYNGYRPVEMILQTDVFFNFVEENYFLFKQQDGTTLSQAYEMYKQYCESAKVEYPLAKYKFREELKNYFREFLQVGRNSDGQQVRSLYRGFISDRFTSIAEPEEDHAYSLSLESDDSIFDRLYADCPAQYASSQGTPIKKWDEVTTTLKDLDTRRLHYVKVPQNHIVIDFDIKDESGKKSAELNIKAASQWPPTYAEFSQGGSGIHLHYIYDGDPTKLSRVYDDNVEVKVYTGNSSLRRRLSKTNGLSIATINSGLPLKGEKPMINFDIVMNEKTIRRQIEQNLRKEVHNATTPSVNFIYKILEDAYSSGINYDVSDMRPRVLAFANNSSHQSATCVKLVSKMHFKSDEASNVVQAPANVEEIIFFDVEVFPNLLLVNWKIRGKDRSCVRMVNPTPQEIETLLKYNLVGFNCRRYDNHILYARYIGYNNEQLFRLSQRIINEEGRNGVFGEAYNLSYTDVYDFCAKKQSLKKWEIELGIHHQELGLPWDQPVPEELWSKVAEYCDNDVIATEAVFEANYADFVAREILSDLSGLSVNDTTNMHTTAIIFGNNAKPQSEFNYWDLSKPVKSISPEMEKYIRENTPLKIPFNDESILPYFPGYKYEHGKSSYRGEDPGEGGYVYAEPGMYGAVGLLDVASMHPSSLEDMMMFGPYTYRFSMIKQARIEIKHDNYSVAGQMFDGKLAKYLVDESLADSLAYALKIAINSVYGLTSAKFDNKCRDPRNVDNIVAKRGALFMIDLKHAVQERGYKVAHIKTDSIKIPDADLDIINFVIEFGKKYGYSFEHEATYDKMCLVNNAVYIAKYATIDSCERLYGAEYVNKDGDTVKDNKKHPGQWTATGAQFAQPYVFKTLFSKAPLVFEDMCETKTVNTALYLDMNEDLPDVSIAEIEFANREFNNRLDQSRDGRLKRLNPEYANVSDDELKDIISSGHDYKFVGKAGLFCPIKSGRGGGLLMREKDGKYNGATGTIGYRWLEAETVKLLGKEHDIDRSYYAKLVDAAKDDISEYGDFEWFIADEPYNGRFPGTDDVPPEPALTPEEVNTLYEEYFLVR